ncbi:MAG TPA: hypothetical protein VN367_05215 [Chlorobaculum sp.]|nr:hypothetical protein [Chlorobaculum sp.]
MAGATQIPEHLENLASAASIPLHGAAGAPTGPQGVALLSMVT